MTDKAMNEYWQLSKKITDGVLHIADIDPDPRKLYFLKLHLRTAVEIFEEIEEDEQKKTGEILKKSRKVKNECGMV